MQTVDRHALSVSHTHTKLLIACSLTKTCFIRLNFLNEAWSAIFCVWFFQLLSSSLLLLVVTQRFGRCVLQPSSGDPCLSGHRNDSTWEIIFKVWLLIKQGIQKLWRSYSNNNVIVFHTYQSEKYHKKFLEKCHEMNSKRKNQCHLDIFEVIFFKNNLIWPFQLLVTRLCSFLCLVYLRGQYGLTYVLGHVHFSRIHHSIALQNVESESSKPE